VPVVSVKPFEAPQRTLLGPGPSDVDPRVLAALARPTIGHLDPAFLRIMDEIREQLRDVFGTKNAATMPMSGTGSAGMETCIVNLVEPGDKVLVGVNGVFGGRMAEVARRAGAAVTTVEAPWGEPLDPNELRKAAKPGGFRLMCVVHAETSTGVLQDLKPLREIADEAGALLLIDCVTSLGGVPVNLDEHGVDAAYSGTQKCLSCPPGLAPISMSERAMQRVRERKTPVQSWYLDLSLIGQYWGAERAYHHTAPINMLFALHESLRITLEEGLDARFARHAHCSKALAAGLDAMGLERAVPAAARLPQLTLVKLPEGVADAPVRKLLLDRYSLEIGGGLGKFKGKAWRLGLMGSACTPKNVMLCLTALTDGLRSAGFEPKGDGVAAASAVFSA